MASSHIKEDNRRIIALHRQSDRQSAIFARRHLSPDSSKSSNQSPPISAGEFQALLQTFRKPNNPQCFEALKRLNCTYFNLSSPSIQTEWLNAFFLDGDRTIHNLVGVFTHSTLDDARIQVEAGICLANLCCTKDQKQQFILARLATPYFITFLADGPETTRISLAIASLHGLGNLATSSKEDKKVIRNLLSQNANEAIWTMIGHNNIQVREAALFALESIISSMMGSKDESTASISKLEPKYTSKLFEILAEFVKDGSTDNVAQYGHCARIVFMVSGLPSFPAFDTYQLRLLISAIEKAKIDWQLTLIFPFWRAIGMILGRGDSDTAGLAFTAELASTFFDLAISFLKSTYVPLRKETLWVLANFFAHRDHRQLMTDSVFQGRFLEQLVSSICEVGMVSLCKDTLRLCLTVLCNMLCFDDVWSKMADCYRWSVSAILRKLLEIFGRSDCTLAVDEVHVRVMVDALTRISTL